MKTIVTNEKGVVTEEQGEGFFLEDERYTTPWGNRWNDLYAQINEATGNAALTYEEYRDTNLFLKFFRHNQDDKISMTYQMSHEWDATGVYPHMHWVPMASGSGNAIFEYSYSWWSVSGTLGPVSSWTKGYVTASIDPSMQYKHFVTNFGGEITPPVGAKESSFLVFTVSRLGSTSNDDTYQASKDHGTNSANIGIIYFDLHYRRGKSGTKNPLPPYT